MEGKNPMMQVVQQMMRVILRARRAAYGAIALAAILLLLAPAATAQLTTGSLSGTARDTTGAVVPNANVTLINQATGDTRATVSNSTGYFTFAAVQPGTYAITVAANGYQMWKGVGVQMNAGDTRTVPDIQLKVGSASSTITVNAAPAQMVPIDSGERSEVISSEDLTRLSLESRNVSELLKILPGVTAVPNGTQGGSSVDFSAEGPMGSTVGVGYSPSGAPYRGGSSYFLDGANIIDPGCNCWSIAVPNPDMTAEVKVKNTFGADSPNGPQVINVTSKSGSSQFHGEAYFYARNQALNSNTWLNNHSSTPTPKQPGQYYYPGGNIGGPILIPHTNFGRNKLFFWAGYEYYKQTLPAGQPFESYIPSAGMMSGNFTASGAGNSALCPSGFSASANNWCNDLSNSFDANGNPIANPAAIQVDPGAAALMKMFPKANADPSTTPGNYNYYMPYANTQNGYVWRARVDYNLNDNTKIFVTYQQGATTYVTPGHVWWNPAYDIPYPGGNIDQPTLSRVLTANMVNVLKPTLTNEFVFGWGWGNEPFSPTNLKAIYKTTLGYSYATVYNTASLVAPSINSAGAQTFPDISQPAFYDASGSYVTKKAIPSFADNVTKVWRNHTLKFGAFTELVGNDQGAWSYPNGQLSYGNTPMANDGVVGGVQTGKIGSTNPTANLVMGVASSFSQNSFAPVQNLAYRTTSVYAMDDWQYNRRLTLNMGIRFDHMGRWYDRQGLGMAVWLPQLYAQDVAENQGAGKMVVEYPGVRWRGIDPGIPNGGMPSEPAYVSPRFGFAYDIQGNGRTVVRGGWGEYVWNDQPPGSALQTSQNMQTYNTPGGQAITLEQIGAQQGSSANAQPAGSITADPYNDRLVSNTYAWNLTVDRQMPWKSLLEVAYVGNSTQHLQMGGQSDAVGIGGSGFTNINKVPLGGLFGVDPVTGAAAPHDPDNTATYNLTDYEPYSGCTASGACYGYGTNSITVQPHIGYSNYNGLQIAWMKQEGRASFNFNYTWSKTLGIVSSTLDAFNLHGNYGILAIDRPQAFNASYAYSLGTLYHGSMGFLGELANGWTISGITTFQTGGNLQPNSSQNLGLTIQEPWGDGNNTVMVNGKAGSTENLSTKTWFGTDQGSILPITTCSPKSGLSSHQLVNFSCLTAPQVGVQGDRVLHPYLGGPIYTDTDLTVYKSFKVFREQNVEFRASVFDFMNHALWGSTGGNLLTLKYDTADGGHSYTSSSSLLGVPESGPCTTSGTAAWGCENQKYPYSGAAYDRIIELSVKYNF